MIGQTLAHYEITEKLGQGGMGAVYRARDAKLGRDVALKLLPADFASNPERLARFRREAKVLASLSHPNIAAIHGLEESKGQVFLVMELAAGEDLSHRLARGAMSTDDVVALARQMADGLEHAHERGVVHRDLKPANVMMSDDGVVKILDFGLARAYTGESPAEGAMENSPTITAAMTQVGTILGTAAYMSPEQARGREVDRRTDIWAFGVILCEALTGARLFEGESISDTLAGVLKTDPDLETLPQDTPVALRWLIERCLQKKPSLRLRDIGEARILLESNLDQLPASSMGMPAARMDERPKWIVPALIAVALIAGAAGVFGERLLAGSPAPAPMIRATVQPPAHQSIVYADGGHLALSPDGSRIAFVATDTLGVQSLWVRRLDSPAAFQMTGTEGATYPFWSPDGTKIGFFSNGALRKIDAAGGVATSICPASSGRGGSWTPDGRILFAPSPATGIHVVSAGGGEPRAVTSRAGTQTSHRWPHLLPDGKHFLFTALGAATRLELAALDDSTQTRVLATDILEGRAYAGHLLFGRDGALWARPFDPDRGEFLGEEVLLAESVQSSGNFGGLAYSASEAGQLVYAAGEITERSKVGVFDLEGVAQDVFEVGSSWADDLSLSPDGRYLALALRSEEQNSASDVWIRDLQRGTLSRLTNGENADDPVWSPTQDAIAYSTGNSMVIRSMSGARPILRVYDAGTDIIPHDWSDDGAFIVASRPGESSREILVIPVDESEEPWLLVQGIRYAGHPVFSHDGKWVAYMSVETGSAQINLREFRRDGGTWQVSSSPSVMPRFGPDDARIYFVLQESWEITSVSFTATEQRPEFGNEAPPISIKVRDDRSNTHAWTMDRTGSRIVAFVGNEERGQGAGEPMELIVGWLGLVGTGR